MARRRMLGVRAGATAVLVLLLATASPAMAAELVEEVGVDDLAGPAVATDVPDGDGLVLPELRTAAPASLGPVQGLSALVRHLALGDPEATLEPGTTGAEVALLQSRLESLGFRPGSIDGAYGGQTVSAVLALQKHEGLERTGVLDPATREALHGLTADGPRSDLLGDRIEIDISRQLIFLVHGDDVSVINTSTGNEQPYIRHNGATAIARTPRGDFAIGTRYNGTQVGFLGSLYRPMYFRGPYAIHGSGSVPGYPASHGCARTSYSDMDYLWTVVPTGYEVYSY